jgi:hypothetical protein
MRPIYRTGVPLPSKCCILYIFSTNISTKYFKRVAQSPFFSSNAVYFIMLSFLVSVFFTYYIQGVPNFNVKFKVCKSVHHRTIQINHQPDATIFLVYYPDVCSKLNMFRAFSRPSSGAQWLQWQSLVLPSYRCDGRAVAVLDVARVIILTPLSLLSWWRPFLEITEHIYKS